MLVLKGVIPGIVAGIAMGVVSEIGYRLGVFKSSIVVVDGTFAQTRINIPVTTPSTYALGTVVHLITSSLFGGLYVISAGLLNIHAYSASTVALYLFLLWLAMLFVALPVAGQGVFGKELGRFTWIEQLVLHMVFGVVLWAVL